MCSSGANANASTTNGDERKKRERLFQQQHSSSESSLSSTPPEIIVRYRANRHWRLYPKEYMYRFMGNLNGKRVLDFGCGTGEISTQLARLGAHVLALDLSPDHISIARKRASLDGVSDCINYVVADCENANLPEAEFDFVVA